MAPRCRPLCLYTWMVISSSDGVAVTTPVPFIVFYPIVRACLTRELSWWCWTFARLVCIYRLAHQAMSRWMRRKWRQGEFPAENRRWEGCMSYAATTDGSGNRFSARGNMLPHRPARDLKPALDEGISKTAEPDRPRHG